MARPPVFVINLERSPGRRARAQAAFDAVGVDLIFHAGVDGAQTDLRQSPLYDRAVRIARYGGDLSSREIGCYLSHLSVMQRCLDEGVERAVIMEDDVFPRPGLAAALDALAQAPACFPLVRLLGLRPRRALPICALTPEIALTWPTHGLCGAQAYYLTAESMRRFLDVSPLILPFDTMLDRYWESGVTIFALKPFVIGVTPQTASDIGERRDLWANGGHEVLRAKLKVGKLADRVARSGANAALRLRVPAWRRQGARAFAPSAPP